MGPNEKVMFQGFRRLCKINSCYLRCQKIDFVEVQKSTFKVTAYRLNLILYFLAMTLI
jgi:hypothetical protein